MDRTELSKAVEAGVVDKETAERLRNFLADSPAADPPVSPDDERFRLIAGFNDIFVTLGVLLVLGAIFSVGNLQLSLALSAVFAWGAAEIFTRRRRMALPSIVLALVFVFACAGLAIAYFPHEAPSPASLKYLNSPAAMWSYSVGAALTAGGYWALFPAAAGAAALHYWRFRVPIDVANGVYAIALLIMAVVWRLAPETAGALPGGVSFLCGCAIFALAMRFDMSDPLRETRRADIAFWLHLSAAPMIANGLLAPYAMKRLMNGDGGAPVVLAIFAVFTLVALIIDRRALIVSALFYAGGVFFQIFKTMGSLTNGMTGAALTLGLIVLGLSIGWRPLRKMIVPFVPLGGLAARLPPTA